MRRSWAAIFLPIMVFALFALSTAGAPAADSGSVSVEMTVVPCISVASDGTVRSNVSAFIFADAAYLTVMAR